MVVNEIGDSASIVEKAWTKGGTWLTEIKKSKFYDEDFTSLASYITKDEHSVETKADGTPGKPRLREASYNTSKNMPLPEPHVDQACKVEERSQTKERLLHSTHLGGHKPENRLQIQESHANTIEQEDLK